MSQKNFSYPSIISTISSLWKSIANGLCAVTATFFKARIESATGHTTNEDLENNPEKRARWLNPNHPSGRQWYVTVSYLGFPSALMLLSASCQPLCLVVARYAFANVGSLSAWQRHQTTLFSNGRFGLKKQGRWLKDGYAKARGKPLRTMPSSPCRHRRQQPCVAPATQDAALLL